MTLLPTPPAVRDYFRYDPTTGAITRIGTDKGVIRGHRVLGQAAGARKYRSLYFKGRALLAHRIAWFLHYGSDADGFIDHINGDPSDNRISNLRIATNLENTHNSKPRGKHGKGVHEDTRTGKFYASIRHAGRRIHLGSFTTAEEARAAYAAAAHEYHGEFARTE